MRSRIRAARPRRRLWIGLALPLAAALAAPISATAAASDDDDDAIVVISGPAEVARGESVDGVFVIHGDAAIAGVVTGDVFVIDGDVTVSGHVEGDLFTAAGQARLLPGARVDGDLRYGDERPVVAPAATVGGEISDEDWDDAFGAPPLVGAILLWVAVTGSALILGVALVMIAPRAADAVFAQAESRMLVCIAYGAATFFAVPFAAVAAGVTLVGLPLGIGILLALLPLGAIAYVTAAWALGRALVRDPSRRVLAFLAGLAILRGLALIPVVGLLVWFGAVVVGLGLLVAAIGATHGGPAEGAPQPTAP